jgi:hypothetical protein
MGEQDADLERDGVVHHLGRTGEALERDPGPDHTRGKRAWLSRYVPQLLLLGNELHTQIVDRELRHG